MAPRGKPSAASLSVLPAYTPTPAILQPPATLSEAAKKVFLDLVTQCDHEHFEASDVPLLAQYAAACALAERAEAELQGEGPPHPKWLAAWEKATRTMANLALRLRLSPQARREKAKALRPLDWSTRQGLERLTR